MESPLRPKWRFVRESALPAVVADLMRSESVRFFFDGLFVKEPGTRKASQWHQDQPYYPVDGGQIAVIWTPLDPVDTGNSLQVVRGSHRWGRWFVPVLFRDDRRFANDDGRFEAIPEVEANRQDYDILSWEMQPGDCIAFHALALHGAPGNPGHRRRRALSTTWLGDDTVFAPRAGTLEPHFAALDFPVGSPLRDEREFPLVWRRENN